MNKPAHGSSIQAARPGPVSDPAPERIAGVPQVRVDRRLFEEQAVLCLVGEMFGPDQDRYLRLAFANLDDRDIPELARRLEDSASELRQRSTVQ